MTEYLSSIIIISLIIINFRKVLSLLNFWIDKTSEIYEKGPNKIKRNPKNIFDWKKDNWLI